MALLSWDNILGSKSKNLANTNNETQLELGLEDSPKDDANNASIMNTILNSTTLLPTAQMGLGMASVTSSTIASGAQISTPATTVTTNNTTPFVFSNTIPYTPYTIGGATISSSYNNMRNSLRVEGDADFQGDIKIRGKSLTEVLDNIEQRLAILHPNNELEDKWQELKELGERYRELEKEIIEKEEMWKILRK